MSDDHFTDITSANGADTASEWVYKRCAHRSCSPCMHRNTITTTSPHSLSLLPSVAVIIFAVVSYTFLFPMNAFVPLDRRTVAVLGAVLCYCTQAFLFAGAGHEMRYSFLQAVDFDVLILLASIMVVRHTPPSHARLPSPRAHTHPSTHANDHPR